MLCTYAIDPGKTLSKMQAIMEDRGAEVIGGMAIRRSDLEGGVTRFVDRLLQVAPAG